MYPDDYHAFRCYQCNFIVKFEKHRTDVSTFCYKCHTDMEPCSMSETNIGYTINRSDARSQSQ